MKKCTQILLLPLACLLVGCGGGGDSTGASGSSSGTSRVGVFITDSFRDDFDHVWTTVYKVELINPAERQKPYLRIPPGRSLT